MNIEDRTPPLNRPRLSERIAAASYTNPDGTRPDVHDYPTAKGNELTIDLREEPMPPDPPPGWDADRWDAHSVENPDRAGQPTPRELATTCGLGALLGIAVAIGHASLIILAGAAASYGLWRLLDRR